MRRSSKVLAVTLALLASLNAMPFGALADQEASPVEGTVTEEWTGEDSTEDQATNETAASDEAVSEETEDSQPESEEPAAETPAAPQPATPEAAMAATLEAAPLAETTLTVGADEAADYQSLAEAVEAANGSLEQTITIELTSDLTVTECARIIGKDIILNGNGHTITRGDGFKTISDISRSWYNPAMIEVTVPGGVNGSVTLLNVTLDDDGRHEGDVFAQAPGKDGSEKYVQDAMVAAYGTDVATASVILGEGAVLRDFGGMSAVRVTGGATLTMQNGSRIEDQDVTDRVKGASGSNGPAGAVWVQGTTAVMEDGAEITNMAGRAFYVDGGNVTIGGRITGTKADADMWQGVAGVGIHVRGGAKATLTSTAYIGDMDTNASNGSVLGVYGSDLDMQQGAVLKNVKGISALYMDDLNNAYSHVALVNGTIDGVNNGYVMRSWYGHIDLGPTSVVQNCVAASGISDGQILYTNNGSRYTLEGKILNNKGTVLYLANQSGARPEAVMKEGAVISGTQGAGLFGSGVAVRVNNGALFTMEGGEISGNGTGVQVTGKDGFKGVTFIMNGGKIVNNTTGISYTVTGQSVVELNGGEVSNNKSSYSNTQISATGGYATDTYENIYLAQGVLKDAPVVNVSFGTLTLDADYPAMWLGRGSSQAQELIKTQVQATPGQEAWQTKGSALWFKTETADTLHFTMPRSYAIDKGIGLYAACVPLNADGTPQDGAKVTLMQLVNSDTLDITLTGLTPGTSYALSLVVTDHYYITVNTADITVYMGGEGGFEGVVNGDNTIVGSHSLPEPGFTFDLPTGVKDISKVIFYEKDGTKTWTAEPYDENAGHTVYKLVPADNQDPLRIQYTDEDTGNVVVEDSFEVGAELNKTFSMSIYKGSVGQVEARVEDDTSGKTYGIILNSGTLTVRGTTANVEYAHLNQPAEAGKSAVRAEDGTTFTINDSDVEANQDAIALLFDDIIENTQTESNRTAQLEAKANEVLKDVPVPADKVRQYEMKYLDLVDTYNGNVWVDAKDANGEQASVTVCWPYPEGTDKNTDFTLLHFEDLHREMNSNEVAGDIASCTVSPVEDLKKTDTHIEFTTTEFSPFALTWNADKPAEPTPTPEPGDNEGDNSNNGNSGNGSNNGGTTSATPAPTAQPAEVKNTAAQPAAAAVIPQTGDESHPMLWVVLLAVSGSLAAVLAYKRRKEER